MEAKDVVERLRSREGDNYLIMREAAALITSLRSDLAKSQQLVKDGCENEDACRRLLARFDKSDSGLTYSVVMLVEEAVKMLDITGSSQSATPAADLIKKRAMDHRLNMAMAGLRCIAECEYPEPGLRDEAARVLQAVYATLGDDEALVRSALSAPAANRESEGDIVDVLRKTAMDSAMIYAALLMNGRPWAHTSGEHDPITGMPKAANIDIFNDEYGEMVLCCSGHPDVPPVAVSGSPLAINVGVSLVMDKLREAVAALKGAPNV